MALGSRYRVFVVFFVVLLFLTYYLLLQHGTRIRIAKPASYSLPPIPDNGPSKTNPSVNLVVASVQTDDISWISKLRIPGLNVVRYVSDLPSAEYHPPVPRKGREAMIYQTYFHDFYDQLPDISIMIHAHEDPWHIEGVLLQSMLFALSHLDLEQVMLRQYANLRVSWDNTCPGGINTTKTQDEAYRQEEPLVHVAFQAVFGEAYNEMPEILAVPCCSQFAVTREAIHRHPKELYARSMDWLLHTGLSDYLAGRVWEHMFHWLFKGEASECPVEWKAYCRMYHVCFEEPDAPAKYNALWKEKNDLNENTEFWREIFNPSAGISARKRIKEITELVNSQVAIALERGEDESIRIGAQGDLYAA